MVPVSSLKVNSQSSQDTLTIGQVVGAHLPVFAIVGLIGGLGAGKTTLVRGIAQGWQALDRVSSPTYTILNIYRHTTLPQQRLFHLDAYRLETEAAAESVGLEDVFDDRGPVLIEWSNKINLWLPEDMLHITISDQLTDSEQRILMFTSSGPTHTAFLATLADLLKEFQ